VESVLGSASTKNERTMTSQEYLLSQAEHCRRAADESADRFVAQELKRLAKEFEEKAQHAVTPPSQTVETA
jgi:hypothetical protein